MSNKKILRTGLISTIAMLASNNAVFAMSCESGIDGYCLTDGNAKFSIVADVATDQYGMDMTVDTATQVWVLDFMVDNPDTRRAAHVGMDQYIGAIDGTYTGNNQLSITGKDIGGYGTVDLGFELNYNGTEAATLIQTYTFTNTSGSTITDLSFLALTDVTLGAFGQGFYDTGSLTTSDGTGNPTGYRQVSNNDPGYENYELIASVNIGVDSYEVSAAGGTPGAGLDPCTNGDLCDRAYNDAAMTTSDSVLATEDDLMMAARWFRTLADGESFSYTQTFDISNVSSVPVPAAVWLFGSGLIGLVGVARRKQSLKA